MGLVAAQHLVRWGASVTAYVAAKRPDVDHKLRLALREGAALIYADDDADLGELERALVSTDVIIDAVLGTGKSRPIAGPLAGVMERLSSYALAARNRRAQIFAVDAPTGVDAGTGRADPLTLPADVTLALGFPKVGHFMFPAAHFTGRLKTLDIGIPSALAKDVYLEMITPEWVRSHLPSRPSDGHKGTYGHALIIGGCTSYPGAPSLAAGAALRSGAGLVTLAAPKSIYNAVASHFPEAIHLPLPDNGLGSLHPQSLPTLRAAIGDYSSLALGCGMGRSKPARRFLIELLSPEHAPTQPLVVDADAMNILAETPDWWERIPTPAVLTPHPGEMSRLTGIPTQEIQSNRIEIARKHARRWGHVVVLKGAYTIVAQPEGTCHVAPFANPLLSVGGTGDVLAGLIAGLLAQGMTPADASACGVFLHGAAAESLRATYGDRGATATDVINALPATTRQLLDS